MKTCIAASLFSAHSRISVRAKVEGLGAGLVREEVLPLRKNLSLLDLRGKASSASTFAISLSHSPGRG